MTWSNIFKWQSSRYDERDRQKKSDGWPGVIVSSRSPLECRGCAGLGWNGETRRRSLGGLETAERTRRLDDETGETGEKRGNRRSAKETYEAEESER